MDKPTIKQCFEYSNNMEQSTLFFHYFESVDWMVGKKGNAKPMQNWKSALTNWIKRSKPKQSKVEQAVSNTSQKLIDLLWVRMTEIYGSKWTSNYGTKPTKPWIDVVSNLTQEQIKHGLNEIIKNGDDWPVSLVKFNKMCRSNTSRVIAITHTPSRKEIELQRENTAGIRNIEMNKLRNML